MELTFEQVCLNYCIAIPSIIFMMWLVPQAVGFKPFFWDLREAGKSLPKDENGRTITDLKLIREIMSR